MSTQFYTQDQPATSQPGTRRAPRPHRGGPSWYRIAAVIIGAVAAAALIVLAISGLTGSSHPAPAPRATASQPASPAQPSASPAQPSANPAQPTTPAANPAQPTTPAVPPSAAVKTLQQQLGQLNYYEGPVDGIMGPQTIAAIKDLQRQAGLPQTGTMTPATQAALAHYLAHGNNQMAG
jgi:predicted lipid-binding transport protein (Tim44 family)